MHMASVNHKTHTVMLRARVLQVTEKHVTAAVRGDRHKIQDTTAIYYVVVKFLYFVGLIKK